MRIVPILLQGAIGEKVGVIESRCVFDLITPSRLPETFIGVDRLRVIAENEKNNEL